MASKCVAVVGGCGALGRAAVKQFRAAGWHTLSVDFRANDQADKSFVLNADETWQQNADSVAQELGASSVHTVFSAAGGWAGGDIGADDAFQATQQMLSMNLDSALGASRLASKVLKPKGKLVLTGASAAQVGTPAMLAYGMSKAAVHHLVRSLDSPSGGLPPGVKVTAVLPETIDTKANREAMPDADTSTWTNPDVIADKVLAFSENGSALESGQLHLFQTLNGYTSVRVTQHSPQLRMGTIPLLQKFSELDFSDAEEEIGQIKANYFATFNNKYGSISIPTESGFKAVYFTRDSYDRRRDRLPIQKLLPGTGVKVQSVLDNNGNWQCKMRLFNLKRSDAFQARPVEGAERVEGFVSGTPHNHNYVFVRHAGDKNKYLLHKNDLMRQAQDGGAKIKFEDLTPDTQVSFLPGKDMATRSRATQVEIILPAESVEE